MKYRSVGMCVVLSIITCGIYGIYWYYCLNEDINEVTGRPGYQRRHGHLVYTAQLRHLQHLLVLQDGRKADAARAEQGTPTG